MAVAIVTLHLAIPIYLGLYLMRNVDECANDHTIKTLGKSEDRLMAVWLQNQTGKVILTGIQMNVTQAQRKITVFSPEDLPTHDWAHPGPGSGCWKLGKYKSRKSVRYHSQLPLDRGLADGYTSWDKMTIDKGCVYNGAVALPETGNVTFATSYGLSFSITWWTTYRHQHRPKRSITPCPVVTANFGVIGGGSAFCDFGSIEASINKVVESNFNITEGAIHDLTRTVNGKLGTLHAMSRLMNSSLIALKNKVFEREKRAAEFTKEFSKFALDSSKNWEIQDNMNIDLANDVQSLHAFVTKTAAEGKIRDYLVHLDILARTNEAPDDCEQPSEEFMGDPRSVVNEVISKQRHLHLEVSSMISALTSLLQASHEVSTQLIDHLNGTIKEVDGVISVVHVLENGTAHVIHGLNKAVMNDTEFIAAAISHHMLRAPIGIVQLVLGILIALAGFAACCYPKLLPLITGLLYLMVGAGLVLWGLYGMVLSWIPILGIL